ncbi:hypothetical protein K491DRAFT_355316 [Lophiostoma macrostomum CBS 122681]|uniref:Uncharacterized protein n=1 Tax=Lophiostoma macrostomum CBS 122681 TaxID=1314788 RepID=A0A6A6TAV0_9PLEO|nr:hypothetical protein K491DRAFT_355316 [Lophiostoma macrostomum CBS 122681]
MARQATTHPDENEDTITSITSTSPSTTITDCFTDFSFCLATSLAIAKRLTWEQTPWTYAPLPLSSRQQIADLITLHTRFAITPDTVSHALLLGTTYRGATAATYPQHISPSLLVVFPHLRADADAGHDAEPARNAAFLQVWHDEIVRPAFNTAWEESGLVSVWRKPLEGFAGQRFQVTHTGARVGHERMGREAGGILKMLGSGWMRRVYEEWPFWSGDSPSVGGGGGEGEGEKRCEVYDSAWTSITGMLRDHPSLREFQDPILVAVHTAHAHLNAQSGVQAIYDVVGRDWDQTIDAKYVVKGTFRVEVRTVVGDKSRMLMEIEKDRERTRRELGGVKWKRMASGEAQGERRAKRARKLETVKE